MTTILAEFDAIIEIFEAAIPANPETLKARSLANKLEAILSSYFRKLERAFPYDRVEQLYNKYVSESLGSETRGFLDPMLATFDADLKVSVNGWLAAAYMHGQAEMITWGKTKGGIPIAYEGPPISNAVKWAERHGATLVTKMNQETQRRLAQVVSGGIQNKRGVPGLARDIRKGFDNMTTYRSQLIAKTETRQALFQASHDSCVDMGITGKEWVLGAGGETGNCEQCEENAAVGVIPINQEFPNPEGDIHPGCVIPGTMVNPLGMQIMTRAHYSGSVIELSTLSGNRLTVTENHPILTPSGFIAAQFLNEGDNIISSFDRDGMLQAINPDYQQVPFRIEDIWNSLLFSPGMTLTSMKTTSVDFHGDAGSFEGNVNIIYPDSLLEGYIDDSESFKHIRQQNFNRDYTDLLPLSSVRFLNPLGKRTSPTSSRLVGIGGKSLSFGERKPVHSELGGLAVSSWDYPRSNQITFDNPSVYSELSRQFQDRFASFITADKVIQIRNYYFSDHVYNLQSLESLYIANGIIVKNCTCAIAPAMLKK